MFMKNTLVFDVETKKSFAQVGGRANIDKLGVSVIGAYLYPADQFLTFEESEIGRFEKIFLAAEKIVGFNIKNFDLPVLKPYFSQEKINTDVELVDLFEDISKLLGHRLGLDALAEATLGVKKSADGLQALRWYEQGEIDKIKKYCLNDVRITKEIYEYGVKNGYVLYIPRGYDFSCSVPVRWGRSSDDRMVLEKLRNAFEQRKSIEIEYISWKDNGDGFRKQRLVDIYRITDEGAEGYCHLRQDVRKFKFNRIFNASISDRKYQIPIEYTKRSLL